MTFFEKAKRFFIPLQSNITAVILSIAKFTIWALYALFSVYIIRESTRLFGLHDVPWMENILYQFIAFSLVFFVVTWFLRAADWPILYHDIDKWIYKHYLEHLMEIENTYLEKLGTGRLIAILTTGAKIWIEDLTSIIKEGTRIIVVTGFIAYLFFSKSYFYWALFLVAFLILHILVVYADTYAHKYRRIRTEKKGEFTRQLVRILMSRNEILQSGKARHDIENILDIIEEVRSANDGINKALFSIFNTVRISATLAKIGILIFIISAGINWALSPADVAGLLALFIVFEGFLIDSVEFYKNFTKDFSDIEKLWEIFDGAPRNIRYNKGKDFVFKKWNFELRNIAFTYNTQENAVFEDFSLSIIWGKKTAFVGHSGSWKTTLMKILAGYIKPTKGKILVDGEDFSEVALKTYYPHIGYLTQDPSVFDATIRENMISVLQWKTSRTAQGKKDAEEKLIEALKLAHCDFVFDLEEWIDTEIGERGIRLSGGQKQRLAIAKIFLKDPEIILLDEPTSALDSFSEEAITAALDDLFQWRTVIIVAHRLQTVKKADDIIVLENGIVAERGNHQELIDKWWIYAKMLELQSGF